MCCIDTGIVCTCYYKAYFTTTLLIPYSTVFVVYLEQLNLALDKMKKLPIRES